MNDKAISIVWTITVGLAIFVAGAIVDAFITVWVFKKYSGCPMYKAEKTKKQV